MEQPIVFLMYHELEVPGRGLCHSDAGYVRYILRGLDFQAQMQSLKRAGWCGLSVSEALRFPATSGVAITFDDGCESDLVTAAPILRELKRVQKREKKSLGRVVSDLLAQALGQRRDARARRPAFHWISRPMGARVNLADKEALHAALELNARPHKPRSSPR